MRIMIREICCVVLMCAAIAGCSSVPDVPTGVSSEGVNYISASRWMGIVHTSTYMYLPGENPAMKSSEAIRCKSDSAEAAVIAHGALLRSAASYCEQVVKGMQFVAAIYPRDPVAIELHLVPAGMFLSERRRSLRTSVPRLSIAAPEFIDDNRTRANIVDLVAHETFHLAGALAGDPLAGDEEMAYVVGLCSQFSALGRLDLVGLPGAALQASDHAMNESSAAAFKVRGQFVDLFTTGAISATTVHGRELAARCKARVPGTFRAGK